jgi:hypothetical protein
MKRLIILTFVIIFAGCKKNVETYIAHLPGYWEIEKVLLADGTEREYSYNETIEYFSFSDSLTGLRKKLKPSLYGKFTSFNTSESFRIAIENDSLNIYYKTPFDTWKETILFANDEQLKIINSNKNVYLYKRYIPLKIE